MEKGGVEKIHPPQISKKVVFLLTAVCVFSFWGIARACKELPHSSLESEEPSEGKEIALFPVAALPPRSACRQPLRVCFLYLCLFSWQEAAPRDRVTTPPPALVARVLAHSTCCSTAAAGTGRAGSPVGIKTQSRRLGGGDGGRAGSCRGTPAAALGGWGHCSAVDGCGHVLPALPDGLLEAMVDDEADPRHQPLLSCAGKCSTLGTGGRR